MLMESLYTASYHLLSLIQIIKCGSPIHWKLWTYKKKKIRKKIFQIKKKKKYKTKKKNKLLWKKKSKMQINNNKNRKKV